MAQRILASDLVRRKREDVFIEGYKINAVTDVTGTVAATEDVIQIFGQNEAVSDVTTDNSTLSITIFDKKADNKTLDALTENDPDFDIDKQHNWENVVETSVFINRKDPTDDDKYISSSWYKDWLPVPGPRSGDAGARAMRTFAGNSAVLREFNQPIRQEKLFLTSGASAYTANLAATPRVLPGESVYALRVLLVKDARTNNLITTFEKEDLAITATMVTAARAVTVAWADIETIAAPTHVIVDYLYDNASGTYPTVGQDGKCKLVSS